MENEMNKCDVPAEGQMKVDQQDIFDGLYDWLEEMKLSRPKKNLARDFSDGLLMAELLKTHFPRHVNLHNYSPANSMENKLKNWIWLNDKVLKPLGIEQDMKVIQSIASVSRKNIENLLLIVKKKVDEIKNAQKTELTGLHFCQGNEDVGVADVRNYVSFEEYSTLKEALNDRCEELNIQNAKIKHLEALVALKDQRIEDLVAQLRKCTCRTEL